MTIRNIAISCRQFFLISTCPFRYTFLLLLPPPHSSLIVVTFTLFLLFFLFHLMHTRPLFSLSDPFSPHFYELSLHPSRKRQNRRSRNMKNLFEKRNNASRRYSPPRYFKTLEIQYQKKERLYIERGKKKLQIKSYN